MKVFQSLILGPLYLKYFNKKNTRRMNTTYFDRKRDLLYDRHCSSHILQPIYEGDLDYFLSYSDDTIAQKLWAKEKGLNDASLQKILLSQIEEFQPDIFYTNDPLRFPAKITSRFPNSVKKKIAWRGTYIDYLENDDYSTYDLFVSNFKDINERTTKKYGIKTAWHSPSWDPEMKPYAENSGRSIDLNFSGGYMQKGETYVERMMTLETLARLSSTYSTEICLNYRSISRYKNSGLLRWLPVPTKIPLSIKKNNSRPVYGRDMLTKFSKAKVVLNPAVNLLDGKVRGNMRCWEALGCGACMLASEGSYPEGFIDGENFLTFKDENDLERKIHYLLHNDEVRLTISKKGTEMISSVWSKERQLENFMKLIDKI